MSEKRVLQKEDLWLVVVTVLIPTLFSGVALGLYTTDKVTFSFPLFTTLSLLLLIVFLVVIWLVGVPRTVGNDIDLESVARDRINATVAILAMVTLLGVVSLITIGATHGSNTKPLALLFLFTISSFFFSDFFLGFDLDLWNSPNRRE